VPGVDITEEIEQWLAEGHPGTYVGPYIPQSVWDALDRTIDRLTERSPARIEHPFEPPLLVENPPARYGPGGPWRRRCPRCEFWQEGARADFPATQHICMRDSTLYRVVWQAM
jgi:hypothetical protein